MTTNPTFSKLQYHHPVRQNPLRHPPCRYPTVTQVDVGKTASPGSSVSMETSFSDRITTALAQLQHACRKSLAALTEPVKSPAYTSLDMPDKTWRGAASLFIPMYLLISLSLVVALYCFGYPGAGKAVAMLAPMILNHLVARTPPRAQRPMRTVARTFVIVFALTCLTSAALLWWLGHPEGVWPVGRLLLMCMSIVKMRRRT